MAERYAWGKRECPDLRRPGHSIICNKTNMIIGIVKNVRETLKAPEGFLEMMVP